MNDPAIDDYGTKRWFDKNGLCIYVEYTNGYKAWWEKGFRHRLDGPAIEDRNGDKRWYYHGRHIDCSSQEEFERLIKLKSFF